ncbi:MAG: SagB/ThcOx family dehydrogenase [Chloroflexi bacterium]|nr:SagB/ThcOx family dehydrogenase [Chloroflexota bacterium]
MATGVTGLMADYLGIPRSVFHRYSAYSLLVLAIWHIITRWPQLCARLKSAFRGRIHRPVSAVGPAGARLPERAKSPILSRRVFLSAGIAGVAGFVLGRWLPLGRLPLQPEEVDLGLAYHQWSKPGMGGILSKPFQWGGQPPLYKEYPSAPRVALPGELQYRGLYVEEAIQKRRSIRDYSGRPLSLAQLSLLLRSAYGITEPSYPLRASPSAGALYPLEIYPVVNRVEGLASGVYHYRPADHSLDTIKEGDFRTTLLMATAGQDMVLGASVVFVITAIFQRTRWKYQERAYRYVLLEAGHLAENLYLAATSLGLGTCAIGAFFDNEVNQMVNVDGKEEAALYIVSTGSL